MVQKNLIKYRRRIRFYCTWLLNSYFMNSFYVVLFLSAYLFIVNISLYLIIFYKFSINLHIPYVLHLVLEISSPDTKAFLCTCYNVCNTSSQEICLLAQAGWFQYLISAWVQAFSEVVENSPLPWEFPWYLLEYNKKSCFKEGLYYHSQRDSGQDCELPSLFLQISLILLK